MRNPPPLSVCHFLSQHGRNGGTFAPPFGSCHQPSVSSSSPPSWKSKSRLGFNHGHSWSLEQTPDRSWGGGPLTQSPPHYIVPLSLRPSLPLPLPILSGLRAALKHPVGHPSPHAAAPYRSVNPPTPTPQLPPHCSVLCLCGAGPIPPYVVLISTQRPSVKKPTNDVVP